MDARLVVESQLVRRHTQPRWAVKFEGKVIGTVVKKQVGRVWFYEAFVRLEGREISLELNTDFDERCDRVLAAFLDPASSVHVRYWLGL